MTWTALLLAVVVASSGPAGDVERVVREFFAAYAAGNVERAARFWVDEQQSAFAARAAVVANARCMRLDSIEVVVRQHDLDTAVVAVDTTMDVGSTMPETQRRILHLRRTGGGWRLTAWTTEEDEAMAHLEDAATPPQLPRTPSMAVKLSEAAILAINRRDYTRAAQRIKAAREIAAETASESALAAALGAESALLLKQQESASAAAEKAREALRHAEASGDADAIAWALLRLGRATGDPKIYRQVVALADRVTELATIAQACTRLTIHAGNAGEHRDEVRYALLAAKYAEASGDRTAILSAALNMAGIYYEQSDWELAAAHYERAAALAHELNFPVTELSVLQPLASANDSLGNHEAAASIRARALELADDKVCQHDSAVMILVEIAEQLMRRGELAAAEREAVTALRRAWDGGGDDRLIRAAVTTLAEAALRQNRLREALRLAGPEDSRDPQLIAARALRRLGRLEEARRRLERQVAEVEARRESLFGNEQQHERFLERHADLYIVLMDVLVDAGRTGAAYEIARRLKARVLREVRGGEHAREAEDDQEKRLSRRIGELNVALLAAAGSARAAAIREELGQARRELEDAAARSQGIEETHRLPGGGEAVPALELTGPLAGAVVLDYVVGPDRTTVFAVRRNGGATRVNPYVIPAGRDELTARVRRLRTRLEQRNLRFRSDAASMYALLLRPVERELAGAKLLCIVPSGPLWNVPFHALSDARGRYLVEKHAVAYAPSAALLWSAPREHRAGAPALLAFANPLIRASTASRYRLLDQRALGAIPEVENEVRQIARLYGTERSRVYVGDAARESALKREAAACDVLHIAAHGLLDDRAPMFSALLLSAAPDGDPEDGLLEAREIAQLHLGARLAVLSACDTGRGRIASGEGVIGLSWALFAAGCPTAVVAQWKAVSATTAMMMIDFHRRLIRGAGTPQALRGAQLALRRDPRFAHPFYWAPFVVLGAP